jgi:CCAAT/enhancer binding protein (C/EBP) gamma
MGSKRKQSNSVDKNTPEYLEKRIKNNRAVKRSRDKTKAKAQEATTRVQRLQVENENLRSTVDNMTAELKYLKEMLICQAGRWY